jgi:3-(methylthio)propanoyl-CoA dehydrogenase
MSTFVAPLKDMNFVLNEVIGLNQIQALPGCEEVNSDLVSTILDEAGKMATNVLDPLNRVGDKEGAKVANGVVTTAKGFKEAYLQFVEAGWGSIECPTEFGGQGLPHAVATAVGEIWGCANMAFKLCPLLTQGAIEALHQHASKDMQAKYLPNMISGKWTGTMNLTEPQAGSDLALVRSKAIPQADGSFKISGQKIFITYGEHDYTENIIHLVLARVEGAPEGVKGISLFVVPKFLVNDDGSLGARNDVKCASIEHKMGIHASPTCVMMYGEQGGATGYVVGEINRGLEYMFVMMNAARLGVGLEGVAACERSYQHAIVWAKERVQGRPYTAMPGNPKSVPIVHHPDIKRMLLTMRSYAEASRALAYLGASALDHAERNPDPKAKGMNQALVDLLIPIIKGWSTEVGIEAASLGVQVHGGMGYIEETGAAQYLRDCRISTIYEGTTGIQGNDLVGRKVGREGGQTVNAVLAMVDKTAAQCAASGNTQLHAVGKRLETASAEAKRATAWIVETFPTNAAAVNAGCVHYLMMMGTVLGGWMLARTALICADQLSKGQGDAHYHNAKLITTRFFADHTLPKAASYCDSLVSGADSVLAADVAMFA